MVSHAWNVIWISWIVFIVVWLIAALKVKPVETREGRVSNTSKRVIALFGAALLLGWHFGVRWLSARFISFSPSILLAGALMTIAGIGLAFWARYHLGQNWGVTGTVRVGHELIRTGPYAFLRHPIYVGIGVALAGTALAKGDWGALAGMLIIVLTFWSRARFESSFLVRRFGERGKQR